MERGAASPARRRADEAAMPAREMSGSPPRRQSLETELFRRRDRSGRCRLTRRHFQRLLVFACGFGCLLIELQAGQQLDIARGVADLSLLQAGRLRAGPEGRPRLGELLLR